MTPLHLLSLTLCSLPLPLYIDERRMSTSEATAAVGEDIRLTIRTMGGSLGLYVDLDLDLCMDEELEPCRRRDMEMDLDISEGRDMGMGVVRMGRGEECRLRRAVRGCFLSAHRIPCPALPSSLARCACARNIDVHFYLFKVPPKYQSSKRSK